MPRHILPLFSCILLLAACSSPEPAEPEGPLTYSSTERGFAVDYPRGWHLNENGTLRVPDATREGIALEAPPSFSSGTTLYDAYVHAGTVKIPCAYVAAGRQYNVLLGEKAYKHSEWTEAGAGHLYVGNAYITRLGDTCFEVVLYTHSCNLGNACAPGKQKPFDRSALVKVAEEIAASVREVE